MEVHTDTEKKAESNIEDSPDLSTPTESLDRTLISDRTATSVISTPFKITKSPNRARPVPTTKRSKIRPRPRSGTKTRTMSSPPPTRDISRPISSPPTRDISRPISSPTTRDISRPKSSSIEKVKLIISRPTRSRGSGSGSGSNMSNRILRKSKSTGNVILSKTKSGGLSEIEDIIDENNIGTGVKVLISKDVNEDIKIQQNPVDILSDYGYNVVSKINLESDTIDRNYIKAFNADGQTVYIEIDDKHNGKYKVNMGDDIINMFDNDKILIPGSMKMGALDAIDFDVYGVMYECVDGLCFLYRDNYDLEPKEINMGRTNLKSQLANSKSDDHKNIISSRRIISIPYPVVRLSEIISSPEQVSIAIREVIDRLTTIAFGKCSDELNSLYNIVDESSTKIKELINETIAKSDELRDSIELLTNINKEYVDQPPKTEDEIQMKKTVEYNLKIRNDMVRDIVGLCTNYRGQINELKKMKDNTEEQREYIRTKYIDLGKLY